MASDIVLDGPQEGWTTVQADVVEMTASDVILDNPARRSSDDGFRRALVHDETDGLSLNFNGDYPGGVTVWGERITSHARELVLDDPTRHTTPGGHRRALAHTERDGLAVNPGGDYPDGVTIRDARPILRVIEQDGFDPRLPKNGQEGEIVLVHNMPTMDGAFNGAYSLWLCVGADIALVPVDSAVSWVQIPFGAQVQGTTA